MSEECRVGTKLAVRRRASLSMQISTNKKKNLNRDIEKDMKHENNRPLKPRVEMFSCVIIEIL